MFKGGYQIIEISDLESTGDVTSKVSSKSLEVLKSIIESGIVIQKPFIIYLSRDHNTIITTRTIYVKEDEQHIYITTEFVIDGTFNYLSIAYVNNELKVEFGEN